MLLAFTCTRTDSVSHSRAGILAELLSRMLFERNKSDKRHFQPRLSNDVGLTGLSGVSGASGATRDATRASRFRIRNWRSAFAIDLSRSAPISFRREVKNFSPARIAGCSPPLGFITEISLVSDRWSDYSCAFLVTTYA